LLSAAMVVFSPAQAMEMRLFDKMQFQGQGGYTAALDQDARNDLSGDDNSRLANSASKLFVTLNPDGTLTVQKRPPNRNSKESNAKEG